MERKWFNAKWCLPVIFAFLFSVLVFNDVHAQQDVKALVKKGQDYIDHCRHKEKESLSTMKKAYQMNPGDFDVVYWTGRAYYENRLFDDAEQMFAEAAKMKPKDIQANAWLGYAYGRIGENIFKRALYMTKSATQIKKVLEMNPNFADAHFSLAIACTYLGWYEKPSGLFRQIAKIFMKTNQEVDNFTAEGLYKKAISINPKSAWYYVQYGWYFLRRNKPADAKKVFDKAIALAGKEIKCGMKDDKAPRAIAVYYEEAKMWDEALKYAKLALQWNPKDLAPEPKYSIKKIISRIAEEKKSSNVAFKDVADELY